jgi:uncharacterized membrane protein
MGFLYTPLPLWFAVSGWVLAAVAVALAASRKPFWRLRNNTLQHLWLGLIVALAALWAFDAWTSNGPTLHLLGAALLVALFDWSLAIIGTTAVIGLIAVAFDIRWQGLGWTVLALSVLPVAVAAGMQRLTAAWLPRNLPVFTLGHGLLAAAVSVLASGMATVALRMLVGESATPWLPALAALLREHAMDVFLLMVAEGGATAALLALLAVYRPAWVTTYPKRLHHLDR